MIKKNLLFIKGAAINLADGVKNLSPLSWLFLGQLTALSLGIAGLVIGVKTSNSLLNVKEDGKDIKSPLLSEIRKDNRTFLSSLNSDLSKWVNEFKEGNSSNLDYLKFFINKQELDNVSFIRSLDAQSTSITDELKLLKDDIKDIKEDVKGNAEELGSLSTNVNEMREEISGAINELKGNLIDHINEISKSMVNQINEHTEWSNMVVTDEIREDTETRLKDWITWFIKDLQENWVLEIAQ